MFTLGYKLDGVAFYANKLPRKRVTLSYLQVYGVISPVNLDYNFDLNLQLQVLRHSVKHAGRKGWSRSVFRLVAQCDLWSTLLLLVQLCSIRSLVLVPSLCLVLRNVDLEVASSGNRRCSP